MREAARSLLGQHDFTTFRASECQANSPIRTLDRLDVERTGEEIRVYASARSFLHHQVRSMVGTLERSVPVVGQWRMCVRRSTRETAPDAAPWRRQPAFTSSVSITGIKPA